MTPDINETISGLLWYAECKQLALLKVADFRPPADNDELRMYHSLYLTNLFSVLDYGRDIFGPDFLDAWECRLEGLGGQSGSENHGYLRELRNAIVHRGEDITASATVIDNRICVTSPLEIYNRSKSRSAYQPFDLLLRNLFAVCEKTVGPTVLQFVEPTLLAANEVSDDKIKMQFVRQIEAAVYMPDWAKTMALGKLDGLPFAEIRGFHSNRLKSILTAKLPDDLEVTLPLD